jgi:hypothetical protein
MSAERVYAAALAGVSTHAQASRNKSATLRTLTDSAARFPAHIAARHKMRAAALAAASDSIATTVAALQSATSTLSERVDGVSTDTEQRRAQLSGALANHRAACLELDQLTEQRVRFQNSGSRNSCDCLLACFERLGSRHLHTSAPGHVRGSCQDESCGLVTVMRALQFATLVPT